MHDMHLALYDSSLGPGSLQLFVCGTKSNAERNAAVYEFIASSSLSSELKDSQLDFLL